MADYLIRKLGYFRLSKTELLEMYIDYVKGGDVVALLTAKNNERMQSMREELEELGWDFAEMPVDDEDLEETLRMRREWYFL